MLFSLLQVSWAINIQKNEVILKTFLLSILSPNVRQFVQDFFFVVDRYVQQIDRAMKTFYNFFYFNILGIVQFKFNSPIVLLHILSQSTCLNRLISIEYNNIVYIRQMHILVNSRKTLFPNKCWFFFPKRFKGHSQFRSFPLVYLIENHFLQNLKVSNVRPTNFLIL